MHSHPYTIYRTRHTAVPYAWRLTVKRVGWDLIIGTSSNRGRVRYTELAISSFAVAFLLWWDFQVHS